MHKDNPYRYKTGVRIKEFLSQMNPLLEDLPVKEDDDKEEEKVKVEDLTEEQWPEYLMKIRAKQVEEYKALVEYRGYYDTEDMREFYFRGRLDESAWLKLVDRRDEFLKKKEEVSLETDLPKVETTHINPEGVIWEQKREIKILRRLLVDKMLELEEANESLENSC